MMTERKVTVGLFTLAALILLVTGSVTLAGCRSEEAPVVEGERTSSLLLRPGMNGDPNGGGG